MLKLKDSKTVPQGYWRFPRDPSSPRRDDAAMVWGGDLGDLVAKVAEYRIINDLPLGTDVRAEVEDWLCRSTNAECVPIRPRGFASNLLARGEDLARFVNAMTAWWKTDEVVPQEEAERRAELCAGCRFNVELLDVTCAGCYGLAGRIAGIIGNVKTRMENNLKYCGCCSCALHVVVYAPLDILDRSHSNSDMPEDTGQRDANGAVIPCWRRPHRYD